MRIMQAKLPVIEIEIGSFWPVLHLSPAYLRPPQAEAAGAVSERIAPLQQHNQETTRTALLAVTFAQSREKLLSPYSEQ